MQLYYNQLSLYIGSDVEYKGVVRRQWNTFTDIDIELYKSIKKEKMTDW
jgi:hypothetical protein